MHPPCRLRGGRCDRTRGRRRCRRVGEIGQRIDRSARDAIFEMQVRPGRPAARSDAADQRCSRDEVARAHRQRRKMRIAGARPVGMGDVYGEAIAPPMAGKDHPAGRGGENGRSEARGEIYPAVPPRAAVKRVMPDAKAGVHRRKQRPRMRQISLYCEGGKDQKREAGAHGRVTGRLGPKPLKYAEHAHLQAKP